MNPVDDKPTEDSYSSSTLISDHLNKAVKELGPLVIIETSAPIPAANIRRKFQENVEFHLDYSEGKYKGRPLINYLSSVDIKVRLKLTDQAEALELVKAYLNHSGMAKIDDLIDIVMNLLLALTGKPHALTFDPFPFAVENKEIISTWLRRIASLPVFAFFVNPGIADDFTDRFPVDDDASLPGINFVQLINHPLFPMLVCDIPQTAWNKNPLLFTERMFAGKNLFYYFASTNNPLHIATISSGEDVPDIVKTELARSMEA